MSHSESSRNSLIPSFLYSYSSPQKSFANSTPFVDAPVAPSAPSSTRRSFFVPAPSEPGKIEMYSPAFYAACTAGGILSCGLTHTAVTPLDLVKCNMQVLFLHLCCFYLCFLLCSILTILVLDLWLGWIY